MSLNATSLTKSAVVGLMPSAEFTPVVSPADCAKADVEIRSAAAAIVRVVIVMSGVLSLARAAQAYAAPCSPQRRHRQCALLSPRLPSIRLQASCRSAQRHGAQALRFRAAR